MHHVVIDEGKDSAYVAIHATPGPEQELRKKGDRRVPGRGVTLP
jgi:hypothetical protein